VSVTVRTLIYQPTNNSLYVFFIKFLLWSAIFQFAVWQLHHHAFLSDLLLNALAQLAEKFSSLFTDNILLDTNKLIHADTGRYIVIDSQCSGLSLIATLLAAFCSLTNKISEKLVMSLIAIVAIQTLNILRISHLFFEIKHPTNHFDIYHLYVWQLINFVFAMGLFYQLQLYFVKVEGSKK